MERVLFDVPAAAGLADRMTKAAVDAAGIRQRIRSLDQVSGASVFATDGLAQAERWAQATAKDLRWRLDQIHLADDGPGLVYSWTHADGRVEADFVLGGQADHQAWERGAALHGDLLRALDRMDGAEADVLLDQLAVLVGDPVMVAGFASMLGANGMAGLIDRIDDAKARDPRNTPAEWVGGSNPRWDLLKAELATIAGTAGGLASYGSDDVVQVGYAGGGLQIMRMSDLLMTHPMILAGKWSADTDISRSPFAEMGGIPVRLAPLGDNVVGPDRLLVTRVEGTPGSAFHWDGTGLAAVQFQMPSTLQLVGQTADIMVTDPAQAIQTAWENPDQAATGFLLGASATVAAAYGWTYVVGQGLVGVGGAAAGSTGATTWAATSTASAGAAGSLVSNAWTIRSVAGSVETLVTPSDCWLESNVASWGQTLGSWGIGSAFQAGGMGLTSTAWDAGFGAWSIPVDCGR